MFLYSLMFVLFVPLILIVLPTKVYGKKNIKKTKKQANIIACNHQSNFDILVVGSKICRHQHFVAKKELGKNKFARYIIKSAGSYLVDRENPGMEFFKNVLGDLKKNKCVTMFPEGTRNKLSEGEVQALKGGLAMFAIKAQCYITPVYIKNKPKLFRLNKMFVGEPFKLTQFDKPTKENLFEATKIISQKFDELKEIANTKNKKKNKN